MHLIKKSEYILRRVHLADMQLLFDWANDNEVRENAIRTNKIPYNIHEAWFQKKVNSDKCGFFILEKALEPVAQIRFDYNELEKAWVIDYSVAKKHRGKGVGHILLKESMNSLNYFPLVAYIKVNNKKSQSIFNSLGFANSGFHSVHNETLIKFTWRN